MKKRRISMILAALFLLGSACTVTAAAQTPTATQKDLNSQGKICYQDGTETVVIDSADLYTLAGRLDQFKLRVAEKLDGLQTYLTKDPSGIPVSESAGIYITHKEPTASEKVDPTALPFDAILKGIEKSRSISTDPTVYGLPSGVQLYQDKEGKLQVGSSEGEGTAPVSIHAATAGELSAGAAAWVDGNLLLGTGEFNQTYYEAGTSESGDSSAIGPGVDCSSLFSNYNSIGKYYGGFNGEIPYNFTPGKSVVLIFDGPFKPTFDPTNAPTIGTVGSSFSMYYWRSNPNSRMTVKVEPAVNGLNVKLLLKEW